MKIKLSILITLGLILSGCSISFGDPPKDIESDTSNKKTNKEKNSNETKQTQTVSVPNIDILSQEFSDNYMNANHVDGYNGLSKNMNKKNIEQKFGKEDKIKNFLGEDGYVYGNFIVMYDDTNDKKIEQYGIIPKEYITYQQFVGFHGEPAQNLRSNKNTSLIAYNNVPNNGYQIAVFTSGDQDNDKIEYVVQYPDNFQFTGN